MPTKKQDKYYVTTVFKVCLQKQMWELNDVCEGLDHWNSRFKNRPLWSGSFGRSQKGRDPKFQFAFILKSVSSHSSIHNLEGILGVEFETLKSFKAWWLIISKWSPFETALLPRFGCAWREGSHVGHTKCSKLSFEHQQKGKLNMLKDTKRTCTKLQTCYNWRYLYQGKTKQQTNFQQEKVGHKQSICT